MNTIESANAAFEALSPEDKRVAIARDWLEQVNLGIISPTHGAYVSYVDDGSGSPSRGLNHGRIACQTCAVGGLLRGMCALPANVSEIPDREQEYGDGWAYRYVRRYFSRTQLTIIETAFEGRVIGLHRPPGTDEEVRRLGRTFYGLGPRTREKLIARNIIRNGGCFLPEDPVMLKTVARLRRGAP